MVVDLRALEGVPSIDQVRPPEMDVEWLKRQKRFSAKAEENQGVVVTEAGLYLRPLDSCITHLKAQGPTRT